MIDLPFRWERIQPARGRALDSLELSRIMRLLALSDQIGLRVKLTLQNFGRYTDHGNILVIGSEGLPISDLEDVWKRIADALKYYPNIYGYQIMNEPHDLSNTVWMMAAQKPLMPSVR